MGDFKEVGIVLFLISLCFIAIPIRIDKTLEDIENDFKQFVVRFNKSYRYDPLEYENRFHVFQVSFIYLSIVLST